VSHVGDLLWQRLTGLMPGELQKTELGWLIWPQQHLTLLTRRRATMIVNRVRLFAFLFAVLTPVWSIVDFMVFERSLWLSLAAMRLGACAAFVTLLLCYRPSGSLPDAYRAMAILFAIPTLFYISSHTLLGTYALTGIPAAIGAGYAFLPFVLLAGLAIFPLTLLESTLIASPILIAQGVAGMLNWVTLNWPSFVGAFWLLALITGVSALAGMSQLAFMIALVRQAIRDPLTGTFSRRSGEEMLEMQFVLSRRSAAPLAIAFLDLDHFKRINDGHGHEAGDQALTRFAERIGQTLRRGDMLIRWGGEEFLLIMPNSDIGQAGQAIGRLREAGFGLRPDGAPLTASIGIAERIADRCEDWKELVDLADRRMYTAKEAGRDRFVAADGIPVTDPASLFIAIPPRPEAD